MSSRDQANWQEVTEVKRISKERGQKGQKRQPIGTKVNILLIILQAEIKRIDSGL